ncbi:hypothetical protein HTZ77_31815 [Nonomuraea sp. SMC257]|uniref:Uncharacterized protein n=1 Tax=Nonomuraea montanisoli TaxID=2741721 RepID=A0A7Y6M630_9ACTN|nr:hypothetical protein [Nonomuraea montanisoli]NUW35972.1 hypothetical protein [Nonomuraea montanisoli]
MIQHTTARVALGTFLAAGLALVGPAAAAHAATEATGTPAAHTAARETFGPSGYGGVKLRMSAKAAAATGKISRLRGQDSPSCTSWQLKAHPVGHDAVGLYISKKRGVALIFAPQGARTPEGIGIGSTYTQIKKLYPRLKTAASGYPYVDVAGNPGAYYSFLLHKGKVYEMALALHTQDCVN